MGTGGSIRDIEVSVSQLTTVKRKKLVRHFRSFRALKFESVQTFATISSPEPARIYGQRCWPKGMKPLGTRLTFTSAKFVWKRCSCPDKPNFTSVKLVHDIFFILNILSTCYKGLTFQKRRYVLRLKWDFPHLSIFLCNTMAGTAHASYVWLLWSITGRVDMNIGLSRGSPIGFSGFGILEEKGSEIRDCNYERDTEFSGFTLRDSVNVVVKNRYLVTKSEKSFHFDNTLVAHIFFDPVTCLFWPYHFYPTILHWFCEDDGIWNLCKALFKTYVRDRDKPIRTVGITGLRENFGRDDGIEEPYWGSSLSGTKWTVRNREVHIRGLSFRRGSTVSHFHNGVILLQLT